VYRTALTPSGKIIYRSDVKHVFKKVDAIATDVDGTLIDITDSYNKAICETVNFFLKKLIDLTIPKKTIREVTQKLRLTGGFNNDWDTTYTIIMGVLAKLDTDTLAYITRSLRDPCIPENPIVTVKKLDYNESLRRILDFADSRGLKSIEEGLQRVLEPVKYEYLKQIRRFLGYPDKLDNSLLASIFDELYYGSELYTKITGQPPLLNVKHGLIENEEVIVEEDTLQFLKAKVKGKLGITTGRSRIATEFILGDLLDRFFHKEALIFIEDILRRERNIDPSIVLKPSPYTLKLCLKALSPYTVALYIGDSAEDAIMVQRVNSEGERVVFIGVYRYTIDPERAIKTFMELNAIAIIPTINELRYLMEGSL